LSHFDFSVSQIQLPKSFKTYLKGDIMKHRVKLSPVIKAVFFVVLLLFAVHSEIFASDVMFRVMTYNTLQMSSDDGDRQDEFATVFAYIQPDIVITQELHDDAAANILLNALGGDYAKVSFIDGDDMDHMMFYKTSRVQYVSHQYIDNPYRREFGEYVVSIGGHELRIYSCHLKSSQGYETDRLNEATVLRGYLNTLPSSAEFLIVGDMNLYTSSEPAYGKFIEDQADNDGRAIDLAPAGMVGEWHNSETFSAIHSQSPRTTSFGGGATGGLDDRFDFIFGNYDLNDGAKIEYQDGSYTVFGNDGNHFNQAINVAPFAINEDIAIALHNASDHLPVYADFISKSEIVAGEPTNHTTSFTATTNGSSQIDLTWSDNDGAQAADGFLIVGKTGAASFYSPVDATDIAIDTDWSNGDFEVKVNHGVQSYTVSGLSDETNYEFRIYPYTNSGVDIDYKTDGTIPSDNATTEIQPLDVSPGDLLITEYMTNPANVSDANGEYIELYNTTDSDFDLVGWTIKDDGSDSFIITGSLVIPAKDFVVIGKGDGTYNNRDYEFTDSDMYLGNSSDEIVVEYNGTEICRVNYTDGDKFGAGIACELNDIGNQSGGQTQESDYVASAITLSGSDLGSPKTAGNTYIGPNQGDLIITEFMANPAEVTDGAGEYFELYNTTDSEINLNGWTVKDDGSDSFVISGSLVVPPNGFIVIGKGDGTYNKRDYEITDSDMYLSNSGDEIVVEFYGIEVCRLNYGSDDDLNGTSSELNDIANHTNGVTLPGNYIPSTTTLSGSDMGSPKSAGITAGVPVDGEPSNHASSFTATAISSSQIDLTWSDNDGAQAAIGFLIVGKTGAGSSYSPVDGTDITTDTDWSDGDFEIKVNHGLQSYTISGLDAETNYAFKIYPYTNSGMVIDYKTDGTIPSANATTDSAPVEITPGDLLITEVMANPNDVYDDAGEYFELYNTTDSEINLNGWTVKDDDSDSFVIIGRLVVPAEGFVVIGKGDGTYNNRDYEFTDSDMYLSNSGDEIIIEYNSAEICRLNYGTDDDLNGTSNELNNIANHTNGETLPANYVASTTMLSGSDYGSPNLAGNTLGTNSANSERLAIPSGTTGTYDFTNAGTIVEFTSPNSSDVNLNLQRLDSQPSIHGSLPGSVINLSHQYWRATVVTGSVDGVYNITFDLSGISGILNCDNLKVLKRDDVNSDWQDVEMDLGNAVDRTNCPNTITVIGLTSFSEFTLGSEEDNPLPVEFSDFSGVSTSQGIKLNWQTQSETDNAGFVILRDGVEIADYKNTESLKGSGTTGQSQDYTFTDQDVILNQAYTYELVSVDYSGTRHSYQKTVEVTATEFIEGAGKIYEYALLQNYPNPFNPSTTINFTMKKAGLATLKVYDMLGRNVFETQLKAGVGSNTYTFNAKKLTSGVYFYKLTTEGFSKTLKMMLLK